MKRTFWASLLFAVAACTTHNAGFASPDGAAAGCACPAGTVCLHDVCVAGCVIDNVVYATGAADPQDVCHVCSARDATGWSAATDGTTCGAGRVCVAGTCNSNGGCDIGGAHWATGAVNPANPCQLCQPASATGAWSSVPDGTACGGTSTCSAGVCTAPSPTGDVCIIGGASYARGAGQPGNPCAQCNPSLSSSGWSAVADGTLCAGGQCVAGTCHTPTGGGCTVGGMSVAAGAPDPTNGCAVCNPTVSTTAYSAVPDGTSCTYLIETGLCFGGTCGSGCLIGGVAYQANQLNPANSCQYCSATFTVATAWSSACCTLNGTSYPIGTTNPLNPCQTCQDQGGGFIVWAAVGDGASCGPQSFCDLGRCLPGCMVAGMFYQRGLNPSGDECAVCDPSVSTTSFTAVKNGTMCNIYDVCVDGNCQNGCYIGGVYYPFDTINSSAPAGVCEFCYSGTSWNSGCPTGKTCVSGKCT
jgi:hypothetical protein